MKISLKHIIIEKTLYLEANDIYNILVNDKPEKLQEFIDQIWEEEKKDL